LKNGSDWALNGNRPDTNRAACYRPSLETFSSTSFSDYIRGVVLGIPIDGVVSDDACYSDDNPSDNPTEESEEEEHENIIAKEVRTDSNYQTTATITTQSNNLELNCQIKNEADYHSADSFVSVATPDLISAATVLTSLLGKENITNRTVPTTCMNPRCIECHESNTIDCKEINMIPKNGDTIQIRKNEEASLSPLHISTSAKDFSTSSFSNSTPTKISSSESITNQQTQSAQPSSPSRKRKKCGASLKPDPDKLSDGMAKITPPEGWWDKSGIGKDTTGRGTSWQKGSKVGDTIIPGPIKQCVSGIGGVYDFTMMELPACSVSEFRDKADAYRTKQVGCHLEEDESGEQMDQLARQFWRRLGPTMDASVYGADMEGSFFDGNYACGWNVDRLESCLQLLQADNINISSEDEGASTKSMPGVTGSYLYFGMWASTFAAHTEDMNLLSINYLHAGAPKYWYAITQEDTKRFESLMQSRFSSSAAICSEFLRHKHNMISPALLSKAGISFTTHIQRAGDIMITFPGCYHFGFNTGFNCAESTNFAVPEWIPYGIKANVCMCHPHSVRIDMKRFQYLLDRYEEDMLNEFIPQMSYIEWVKSDAKRRKEILDASSSNVQTSQQPTGNKGKKSTLIVEVARHVKGKLNVLSGSTTNKKRKTAKNKPQEKNIRLAIPSAKKSSFTLQKPVLCALRSENDEEKQYFTGTVVSIVEGYVRIHFSGTSGNDDVWMPFNDHNLFIDGGPAPISSSIDVNNNNNKTKKAQEKSKNNGTKKIQMKSNNNGKKKSQVKSSNKGMKKARVKSKNGVTKKAQVKSKTNPSKKTPVKSKNNVSKKTAVRKK